jgi:hypothetical protein
MDGAGLTPLERIELRGLLQDRWRDQVRLITLLLLAQCEVADTGESTWSRTPLLDAAALEIAVRGHVKVPAGGQEKSPLVAAE